MRERADGSPLISHAQSLPSKHPAAIGVLARLGMASSCTRGMKAAGLGRGMTGMLGMRGDSGRMAHLSGAAIEASFGGSFSRSTVREEIRMNARDAHRHTLLRKYNRTHASRT